MGCPPRCALTSPTPRRKKSQRPSQRRESKLPAMSEVVRLNPIPRMRKAGEETMLGLTFGFRTTGGRAGVYFYSRAVWMLPSVSIPRSKSWEKRLRILSRSTEAALLVARLISVSSSGRVQGALAIFYFTNAPRDLVRGLRDPASAAVDSINNAAADGSGASINSNPALEAF